MQEVVRKAVERVWVGKAEKVTQVAHRLKVGEGAAFLTPLEFKAKREGSEFY